MLDALPEIFREAVAEDLDDLVQLGAEFFAESEFGNFTEFDPDNFRMSIAHLIGSENGFVFVFRPEGEIEGFVAFTLECSYTKHPIALLFLLYATPAYRKSAAGRLLMKLSLDMAEAYGARAFYAGAMSGVPGTGKTLANMYRKMGFEDLAFWGRKIL